MYKAIFFDLDGTSFASYVKSMNSRLNFPP